MSFKPCRYIVNVNDGWINICKNKNCKYAHSKKELKVNRCRYRDCRDKNCRYLQYDENIEEYMNRLNIFLPEDTPSTMEEFISSTKSRFEEEVEVENNDLQILKRPQWNYNLDNFKLNLHNFNKENFRCFKEILNNQKDPHRGYYIYIDHNGSGCGGYWDRDISLYIRTEGGVLRYRANDCSCNGFDEHHFKDSESFLSPELYLLEKEYVQGLLPQY